MQGKNIVLKLSATQMRKNGGALGALFGKLAPMVMKLAPGLLGTLGLSAISGAVSGATNKAVRGSGRGQGSKTHKKNWGVRPTCEWYARFHGYPTNFKTVW